MSKRIWFVMFAALMVAGLLLLAGCGDKKTEVSKSTDGGKMVLRDGKGQEVKVDVQGGKIEIEGKGGKAQIMETSAWPADMFPEVPQFTMGQVKHVQKHLQADGQRNFLVVFGNVESDAVNKYADILKNSGWELTITSIGGQGGMIGAKKEKLNLTFTFASDKKEAVLMAHTIK